MKIPDRLPVMLLPGCSLFPHGLLPLHIFEPKYRQMLEDVIEGERMFCIGMVEKPSHGKTSAGVHSVTTAGFLRACVAQPDGCSNLLLQGVSRIRLSDFDQTLPYITAAVEVLKTDAKGSTSEFQIGREVRELALQLVAAGFEVSAQVKTFLEGIEDLENLGDLIAYNFVSDPYVRQPWLEELHLATRLNGLANFLERQLSRVRDEEGSQ